MRCIPLKCVFVISNLSIGGAETSLLRLLERIDPAIVSPHVISLTSIGEIGPKIAALGVPVEALGMRRGVPNLRLFFRLVRRVRQIKPDLVHTWMYHADLLGGLAAKMAYTPAIVWGVRSSDFVRADTSFLTRLILAWCSRFSAWLPDLIVYNSEKGKEVHNGYGYKGNRCVVIPNGVDLEKFKPSEQARRDVRLELQVPLDTPLIGLIGRFDPLKNLEGFIEAASLVHREMPRVHFVMVGRSIDWSNRPLIELIEGWGLSSVFHLLGRREDIPRITASLDVTSLTSWSEAFPNVLLEAMASGVPCVSTDVGDARLILGDAGFIVPAGDMKAFAEQCTMLLRLSERERMFVGTRGRARAAEQFDLGVIVKRYETIYRDVVARKSLSGRMMKDGIEGS